MKKKINCLLRKCKTLSRQLGRSSSYSSLERSKSARESDYETPSTTVLVGSSRRRYLISSKYLNHPLLTKLIQKSNPDPDPDAAAAAVVKCEVVLFDHLLWMLENADPNLTSDSLEELAELYVY